MKANLAEVMPDICGLYVLTAKAGLGCYGEDKVFRADDSLSQSLSGLLQDFLRALRQSRETKGRRIGIVHMDHINRPWHSATLEFEDRVLHELYPVPSAGAEPLTAFQHGNCAKSLFRGLEIVLNHHDPLAPEIPGYCPVLVYRGTTLAQYRTAGEGAAGASTAQTPVVEMIDLLAGASLTQRCHPAVAQLVRAVRHNVIKPERRRIPNLHLLDDVRASRLAYTGSVALADNAAGQRRRLA